VELSRAVGDGEVERNPGVDARFLIPGWPEVQVIGNVRSDDGELRAMFSRVGLVVTPGCQFGYKDWLSSTGVLTAKYREKCQPYSRAPPLPTKTTTTANDDDSAPTTTTTMLQYDPELKSPVWHTDQVGPYKLTHSCSLKARGFNPKYILNLSWFQEFASQIHQLVLLQPGVSLAAPIRVAALLPHGAAPGLGRGHRVRRHDRRAGLAPARQASAAGRPPRRGGAVQVVNSADP
jgi:hypothetical protein